MKPTKRKAVANVPMQFPHPFWERVLNYRTHKPSVWALFSPGFRYSAETYEQQRDRTAAVKLAA